MHQPATNGLLQFHMHHHHHLVKVTVAVKSTSGSDGVGKQCYLHVNYPDVLKRRANHLYDCCELLILQVTTCPFVGANLVTEEKTITRYNNLPLAGIPVQVVIAYVGNYTLHRRRMFLSSP